MKFSKEWEQFVQVPAVFLKEYICDAPPEYVKVYLFGLYLAQQEASPDITDLEDRLHLSKDRIDSALNYWQKKGFVVTDGDGTRFVIPGGNPQKASGEKVKEEKEPLPEILYEKAEYNKVLNKLLNRRLTHSQLQKIYDFTDVFKIPESVVISMIEHCVTVKGSDVGIAYLDKVAKSWADKGITTHKQAQAQIDEYNAAAGGAKKIMKQMGLIGKLPGATELEYYEKWTKEWGFKPDAILYAMKNTEFASINQPFKYLDEILRSFKEKGAVKTSQIYDLAEKDKKERSEFKEIIKALSAKSRTVNSADWREYYKKWLEAGVDREIILKACGECGKKGSAKPQTADRILDEWKKAGLNTDAQVSEHIEKRRSLEDFIARVYEKAGITKQAGDRDVRLFETLLGKYQMSGDMLFFAAEISAERANDPYTYFKKILRVWAENGIKTLSDARRHDGNIKASYKLQSKPGFAQREFDEKAEKQRRVMEMLKEGERINALKTNS